MGTRGLIGLITKGKRHGAYNNYDSYPSGIGQQILEFILNLTPEQWDEMAKKVEGVTWVEREETASPELVAKYQALGVSGPRERRREETPCEEWWYVLNRVDGISTLNRIFDGTLEHIIEEVDFLEDGVMCEFAYFIDFENRKLETYVAGALLDEISFENETFNYGYMEYINQICRETWESV